MATTEAELVRAVAADIDDAGAWQVYLDWLLEREDPRAELVRLELLREDAIDDDKERKLLDKQIGALVETHREAWFADLERRKLPVDFAMHRGVVGHVVGSPQELAKHAAAILELAPLLTSVGIVIDSAERDLGPLADSPLLERARWLEVRGTSPVRATSWPVIAAPHVRRLELTMLTLSAEDVEAIVAQPWPALDSLTLSWNRYNKHALVPLAKLAAPLRRFDCAAGHAGPSLGEALGKFTGLTYLRIPGNEIGSAGLVALRPALANVTHLDLRGNQLGDADVPLLLGQAKRSVLKLGGNDLGPRTAELIAAWPNAKHLTRLDLGAGIGEQGARALATSTQLSTRLEVLTLSGIGIPAEVGPVLLASPQLANARIYVGFSMLGRKKLAAAQAKAAKAAATKKVMKKATKKATKKVTKKPVAKKTPKPTRKTR